MMPSSLAELRTFLVDVLIVYFLLVPLRLLYALAGIVDAHNEAKWGKTTKHTYWNLDRSNPNENPED